MEHHAEVLIGRVWHARTLSWRDAAAMVLLLAVLVLVSMGAHAVSAPFVMAHQPTISLSPAALPGYALRTTLRMLAAMTASLAFTLTYATAAAKSRRAEWALLIPLLDALQSVPVLGYLSFTVTFLSRLDPRQGARRQGFAAIFAIFTAQAWNMAFSFYQSLRTIPADLERGEPQHARARDGSDSGGLEVPFALPGLIWNTMMSMAGSWFFVVVSEAISVGSRGK